MPQSHRLSRSPLLVQIIDFFRESNGTVLGEPWTLEPPYQRCGYESVSARGWSNALPPLCPADALTAGQSQCQKPHSDLAACHVSPPPNPEQLQPPDLRTRRVYSLLCSSFAAAVLRDPTSIKISPCSHPTYHLQATLCSSTHRCPGSLSCSPPRALYCLPAAHPSPPRKRAAPAIAQEPL